MLFFERKAFDAERETVLSGIGSDTDGVISGEEISCPESFTREDLQMWLEEADVRVIPHIHKAVSNGVERVVVLSNDTDVVVLLHFRLLLPWTERMLDQNWNWQKKQGSCPFTCLEES